MRYFEKSASIVDKLSAIPGKVKVILNPELAAQGMKTYPSVLRGALRGGVLGRLISGGDNAAAGIGAALGGGIGASYAKGRKILAVQRAKDLQDRAILTALGIGGAGVLGGGAYLATRK